LIYAGRITVTGLGTMVCPSLAGTQGMMAKSTQTSRGENKKIPFLIKMIIWLSCANAAEK